MLLDLRADVAFARGQLHTAPRVLECGIVTTFELCCQ
jgi:hypothetical protein